MVVLRYLNTLVSEPRCALRRIIIVVIIISDVVVIVNPCDLSLPHITILILVVRDKLIHLTHSS